MLKPALLTCVPARDLQELADRRDGRAAALEAGCQELLDSAIIVGFDEIVKGVLGVASKGRDDPQARHVLRLLVQHLASSAIDGTALRRVDLRDQENNIAFTSAQVLAAEVTKPPLAKR